MLKDSRIGWRKPWKTCLLTLSWSLITQVIIAKKTKKIGNVISSEVELIWAEADQYAFALEYKGPKIASTFVGEVVSIDEPWDSIVSNYKCFTTPFANFKAQFVNEANEYEYSLKIRNLKEEAKDDTIESGISDNDDWSKLQNFKYTFEITSFTELILAHYSKSQILHQNFLAIFLVKSKLSTAGKSKTTTFSRVFNPKKNRQFSREIKVEFLDKKWRFRTVWVVRVDLETFL